MKAQHMTPRDQAEAVASATRTCLAIAEAAQVHDSPVSLLAAMAVMLGLSKSALGEVAESAERVIGMPGMPAEAVKRYLDALEGIARLAGEFDDACDTLKDVARKVGAFAMVVEVLKQMPQPPAEAEAKQKAAG